MDVFYNHNDQKQGFTSFTDQCMILLTQLYFCNLSIIQVAPVEEVAAPVEEVAAPVEEVAAPAG